MKRIKRAKFYLSEYGVPFFMFNDKIYSMVTKSELVCGERIRQNTIDKAKRISYEGALSITKESKLGVSVSTLSSLRSWLKKLDR